MLQAQSAIAVPAPEETEFAGHGVQCVLSKYELAGQRSTLQLAVIA